MAESRGSGAPSSSCGVGCEVQRELKLDKIVWRDSWAIMASFRILQRTLQVIPGAREESVEGGWGVSVLCSLAAAFRKINWGWLKGDGIGAPDFGNDGLGAVLDKTGEMTFVAKKDGKGEKEWCEWMRVVEERVGRGYPWLFFDFFVLF